MLWRGMRLTTSGLVLVILADAMSGRTDSRNYLDHLASSIILPRDSLRTSHRVPVGGQMKIHKTFQLF